MEAQTEYFTLLNNLIRYKRLFNKATYKMSQLIQEHSNEMLDTTTYERRMRRLGKLRKQYDIHIANNKMRLDLKQPIYSQELNRFTIF